MTKPVCLWAIELRWANQPPALLGDFAHGNPGVGLTRLFRLKREALLYINRHYSYIASRADLRGPPHHWRMPRPVRVTVQVMRDAP